MLFYHRFIYPSDNQPLRASQSNPRGYVFSRARFILLALIFTMVAVFSACSQEQSQQQYGMG
jgi:hypothetical protein